MREALAARKDLRRASRAITALRTGLRGLTVFLGLIATEGLRRDGSRNRQSRLFRIRTLLEHWDSSSVSCWPEGEVEDSRSEMGRFVGV